MSIKKQLLDPVGTLCKLIALNFNEINSKISIQNHILTIQKPYNYQFFIRMLNGDGRENVSELFYVIIRVIKWYLINNGSGETTNLDEIIKSDEIKRLVIYSCSALRRLQETYEYGNVVLAVQFYINILEDAINNTYSDNKLPEYIIYKEREFENLIDYEKLKNFWDYKKLKMICELYDNCFNVYNDNQVTDEEKIALIEGYLRSINTILDMIDSDFQKLIQNSSKG